MHTFFMKAIPEPGSVAGLEKREHDHLFKTLRCRPGEKLKLCDGNGVTALAEATLEHDVKILERNTAERSNIEVHLFAALPKNAKLDALLKPVTEAGVASITPLKCRYSVAEKSAIPERWHLLLEEACKQSGNPFLPQLNGSMTPAEAIEHCKKNNFQIFYGSQHGRILQAHDIPDGRPLKLAWFVGPEGGFDDEEINMLDREGSGISLGKYIFRLENAALAGVAYLTTIARVREVAE